jgi:acyl-coenzyme A synthetase/AMP-(fatty) acid ligase
MIITAGYNVAGPEVEAALLQHPAVAECGVVGKPDDERGMIILAYVVLKPGQSGDAAQVKALQDHVKQTWRPTSTRARSLFDRPAPHRNRQAAALCAAQDGVRGRRLNHHES